MSDTAHGLLDLIGRVAQTLDHPTPTCAMGTVEGSVVDPQLKVHGNTNATTSMIAEKTADLIRGA